jgi:hypothetical protein
MKINDNRVVPKGAWGCYHCLPKRFQIRLFFSSLAPKHALSQSLSFPPKPPNIKPPLPSLPSKFLSLSLSLSLSKTREGGSLLFAASVEFFFSSLISTVFNWIQSCNFFFCSVTLFQCKLCICFIFLCFGS